MNTHTLLTELEARLDSMIESRIQEIELLSHSVEQNSDPVYRAEFQSEIAELREIDAKKALRLYEMLYEKAIANLPSDLAFEDKFDRPATGRDTLLVLKSSIRAIVYSKFSLKEKTLQEAMMLENIANRADLPQEIRNRFPRVYAKANYEELYGYLMEGFDSFIGWDKIIFDPEHQLHGKFHEIVDVVMYYMKLMYKSSRNYANSNGLPVVADPKKLYLDRIKNRMEALQGQWDIMNELINSESIIINGEEYHSWKTYYEIIDSNIDNFRIGYATFIHGDAHPGNILIKQDNIENPSLDFDLRFIDPRPWGIGDWVFDICKICHHLDIVGKIEDVPQKIRQENVNNNLARPEILNKKNETINVRYDIAKLKAADSSSQLIKTHARDFAIEIGDTNFEERFNLGMASILIGLPGLRINLSNEYIGDDSDYSDLLRNCAIITYCEGLKWMKIAAKRHGE